MKCGARLDQPAHAAAERAPEERAGSSVPTLLCSTDIGLRRNDHPGEPSSADSTDRVGPDVSPDGEGAKPDAALNDLELVSPPAVDSARGAAQNPWRFELSERLEKLRERRAGTRNSFDPDTTLEFAFDATNEDPGHAKTRADVISKIEDQQSQARGEGRQKEKGFQDAMAVRGPSRNPTPSADEEEGWPVELSPSRQSQPELSDVLLDSGGASAGLPSTEDALILHTAPLGRRLIAGVWDALVLFGGACIFGLTFWIIGGRISLNPLNLAVIASIFAMAIVVYFGLFTAITRSTPGLRLMNLEVRNLEGQPPTLSDSLLRALGYVVSVSAFMLGFIWAAVDSEGLTWHDRMSGTFVTNRDAGT